MIANPIKKGREEKRLTQVDMALLIGVSKFIFPSLRQEGSSLLAGVRSKRLSKTYHEPLIKLRK